MTKTIVIEDTEYELTRAYEAGAQACRNGVPYFCNPYRNGSQKHDDWNVGHVNEDEKS